MPAGDDYTVKKIGVLTFRGNAFRQNAAVGEIVSANGLTLSGISPDGKLVETVELTDRDFYVGVQYHPEFKSRPNKPHPLFLSFVGAAAGK